MRVADADRALGTGTRALPHTVEQALADVEPTPDAVHAAVRARFPGE